MRNRSTSTDMLLNREKIKSQILDNLKKKNSMHQNELSRVIGISPNSLKRIANELMALNLIEKTHTKRLVIYKIKNRN